ncbi:hypothetical protein FJY84_06685 [Candidatus Bathyarchaeota archaeon]|nr:hypothetical protein [Candidatus Bathyarchaeota archaeon]
MEPKILKGEEADQFIINILKNANQPITTREVQAETEKKMVRCPDSTVVFLNKLRIKGLIKGEMSKEKKAWIWWI